MWRATRAHTHTNTNTECFRPFSDADRACTRIYFPNAKNSELGLCHKEDDNSDDDCDVDCDSDSGGCALAIYVQRGVCKIFALINSSQRSAASVSSELCFVCLLCGYFLECVCGWVCV